MVFRLMPENVTEDVLQHGILNTFRRLGADFWQVVKRDTDCVVVHQLGEGRWSSNVGRSRSHGVDDWFRHHRLWLWGARRGVIIRQEWHPDFRSSLLDGKILGSWDDNASVEWIIVRRDVVCGLGGELGSLPSWERPRWSQIFGEGSHVERIIASNSLVQLISAAGSVEFSLLIEVSDILLAH